jgi:hypothetical protein
MSIQIASKGNTQHHNDDTFDTDNSSKVSYNSVNFKNVSTSTALTPSDSAVALRGSKKRINEASLSVDEVERLQAKRAYNRECASRARQRGKEIVAQLEKQVKDLHDDKSELRRTVATMEKRLKLLQRENEILLSAQATNGYDSLLIGRMMETDTIQFLPTRLPLAQGIRSTDFNSAMMTMDGASYKGQQNLFY